MEIIFYILVGIGLLVIFGKVFLLTLASIGGIIGIIIPLAILCAIIYIIFLIL